MISICNIFTKCVTWQVWNKLDTFYLYISLLTSIHPVVQLLSSDEIYFTLFTVYASYRTAFIKAVDVCNVSFCKMCFVDYLLRYICLRFVKFTNVVITWWYGATTLWHCIKRVRKIVIKPSIQRDQYGFHYIHTI